MNTTIKKIFNIITKVLTWLLVAFTVFMMIFTVVTVTTVNKNERSIFGYKFYIVQTDSMSESENNAHMDVHFNAGDIIIVKNVKDPTTLEEGDIISFMSANKDSFGETITHMIHSVVKNDAGKTTGYKTYGTNTGAIDEAVVEPETVLGKYVGKLPLVGRFFAFVKTTPGYIVCILIPFLALILYNLANVIKLFRKYKKEQTDAIAAERQQIEDERAENQRMMAELLELKAQLMKNSAEGATPTAEKPETTGENQEKSDEGSAEKTEEIPEDNSTEQSETDENDSTNS